MNIQEFSKKYSTFSEYSKSFRKARSDKDLAIEQMIYNLITGAHSSLGSVVNQIKGLEFVVTYGKQRISADTVEKYRNFNAKVHKNYTASMNKNGKLGVVAGVKFNGGDMKDITFFLKNKTIMTSKHCLGLKGGFVMDETGKLYYLSFIDIDNKGALSGKASDFRKACGVDTFTVATPSGGYHLYLLLEGVEGMTEREVEEAISDSKLFGIPNVDIKMKGYVLSPGSTTEKGTYEVINDTEIATMNLKTWRIDLLNKIKPWLIENEVSYNGASQEEEIREKNSIELTPSIIETQSMKSLKKMESETFKQMFLEGYVPEGSRNSYLFWTASYIVGQNYSHGEEYCLTLLTNERDRVAIDSNEFDEKVLTKMIQWLFNKQDKKEDSIELTPSMSFKKTDLSGHYTKQLIEKLSTFTKSETFEIKLEPVAKLIQRYFELRFGKEYSKPILTKAVGDFLTSAGFSKKLRRFAGDRTNFWNISQQDLLELEVFVDSFDKSKAVELIKGETKEKNINLLEPALIQEHVSPLNKSEGSNEPNRSWNGLSGITLPPLYPLQSFDLFFESFLQYRQLQQEVLRA